MDEKNPDPIEIRDAIIELCLRAPESIRLLILATAWEQVALQGHTAHHFGAVLHLLSRPVPAARESAAAAAAAYRATLDAGLKAAREAGEAGSQIVEHRGQHVEPDVVQGPLSEPDLELDGMFEEIDLGNIARRPGDRARDKD
jgi:hypothetical protein